MSWSAPLPALALVGAVLTAGAGALAMLDHLVGARTAGRPVRLLAALGQPVARSALLLLTRRATTPRTDAAAWALAPAVLVGMAAAAVAAVPWDRGVAVADVDDGIVLVGAAFAVVMVGVYLHGWAANSPLPLHGGYRFVALALSYEMPLALVLIAAALPAESLSIGAIVESQAGTWNVVRQPLGLPLYLVAGAGLAFWGPLNVPDAGDLGGGTAAEVSGPARLAWAGAQGAVLTAVAVVGAGVFLGGWHGPLLPGAAWTALKALALLALLAGARHRLARVRLERFVVLAWTVLIPLALVDVFVSGALAL
ncbi:MAG TPA: NADH-quinone oxidoreductase subunit H [Acidimicrobiales bacterium]|nr:NADH-quinone oxidoreductase subunit H [Acidimicrobiales bacterium]